MDFQKFQLPALAWVWAYLKLKDGVRLLWVDQLIRHSRASVKMNQNFCDQEGDNLIIPHIEMLIHWKIALTLYNDRLIDIRIEQVAIENYHHFLWESVILTGIWRTYKIYHIPYFYTTNLEICTFSEYILRIRCLMKKNWMNRAAISRRNAWYRSNNHVAFITDEAWIQLNIHVRFPYMEQRDMPEPLHCNVV